MWLHPWLFVAGHCGRLVHRLLLVGLALGMLAVVAVAALAWRLSQGPVDMAWAARRIEAARNTPDARTRLSIGRASISWAGFSGGADEGLRLHLDDVTLTERDDGQVGAIGRLDLSVAMGRLLLGQVVPRVLSVGGLHLELVRSPTGGITTDLGDTGLGAEDEAPAAPGPGLVATVLELARPARRDGAPLRPGLRHLEQLRTVRIDDATLTVHDPALHATWHVGVPLLDLQRQPDGGVRGAAEATVGLGTTQARLSAQADLGPNGGTVLQVSLQPLDMQAVQQAAPGLTGGMAPPPGNAMDAAVQAAATLHLDPALRPQTASLRVEAGGGTLHVAGAPIGFDSLAISAQGEWDRPAWQMPQHLVIPRAKAVVHAPGGAWPTTVQAEGTVRVSETGIEGQAALQLDHVQFADIPALWPAKLGGHVRPWMVANIPAGSARDGTLKLTFHAAPDLSSAALSTIDGSIAGEDLTVRWVPKAPPVEHGQALLTIHHPDMLDIAVSSARQGPLSLANGLMHITGLSQKDQFMALTTDLSGGVADAIALLKLPALQLLDRSPIVLRNPAGRFTGKLTVNFPLNEDLDFDQVKIHTTVRATDLHLGGTVGGRDIDRGAVTLDATSETLKVTGNAAIAGIPADITVGMDFRPGPASQVTLNASAVGRASGRQIAGAGFDPGALMEGGTGQFDARYQQRRDGGAELQIKGDLRDARMTLLDWHKAPGLAAEVQARLLFRNDRMLGISPLHLSGPAMLVDGRVDMVGADPLLLVLDRVELGRTRAQGQVRFPARPNEPIRATLSGTVLDIEPSLSAPTPATPPPPGPTAVADLRFDRALLSGNRGVDGLVAHVEHDGRRIARLQATTAGPEHVELSMAPEGGGRRLVLTAADGGATLRALDVLDTVRGGALRIDAVYDDRVADSPLAGTVTLDRFTMINAPLLGKVLQAATIYGMFDALSGAGLNFSQLILPFRWEGGVLEVREARAFSASLGLTAQGRVDTRRKTIDLRGTLVPAYVVNSVLGRIPVLGRLFSNERGGGLVAIDYTLRGPVGDPAVMVNPLSALTPGFLRGLFHIFD